jgi:hypothetical protein
MAILVAILCGLFVLLIALLVTPIRFHATCLTAPELIYRVDLRVLGGFSPRFALIDSARPRKPKTPKPKPKHAGRFWRWPVNHVAPAAGRLLSGVFSTIHLDHFRLDMNFGLSDPANTGQLYGVLTPLQFGGVLPRNAVVSLHPDFGHQRFSCELDAALHITVAVLFWPLVRFAWQIYGPNR